MTTSVTGERHADAGLRPPAWAIPFVLLLPYAAWFDASRRALHALGPNARPASVPEPLLVSVTLAAVVAGVIGESLFHRMLWAARGESVAFVPLALALWQLSILEPIAAALLERWPAGTAGAVALAPWVGIRALLAPGAHADALTVAFGGAGLLAALRIALSALVQARLARRRWRVAAAQVMLVWLASHVALAWIVELARGPFGGRP